MGKEIEQNSENNEKLEMVLEQLRKIESFTTDKGSVYSYDADGHMSGVSSSRRSNFGVPDTMPVLEKKEKQDITVFAELDFVELEAVKATFKPGGKHGSPRVIEAQPDNSARIITNISEITDPERLALGIIKDGKEWTLFKKATLVPTKGFNHFDWKSQPNGAHERSIGGKETEIKYKK